MKCFETGKQVYLTPQGAHDALHTIKRKSASARSQRAAEWHPGSSTAYRCSFCNGWHIGHATPKTTAKERTRG
jgi:hypothetical protein